MGSRMSWLSLGRLLPIRANTLRSLGSKVAPQNEGSEVAGAQQNMYWRERLMRYEVTDAFPHG